MPRQQFLDVPGGDHVTYDVVTKDGFRLYSFFDTAEETRDNFDNIQNKKCRKDDVLLISYPKTGTHWLWEILTMLLLRKVKVTDGSKHWGMLEGAPVEEQEAMPSPRILNTHILYRYIPKEAREKMIKCILLLRNPKDTAVSFYNHTRGISGYEYDGKFENFLEMFMRGEVDYGSYPRYMLEWQQAIRDNPAWPIHVVYYEDLKKDDLKEMRQVCDYMGIDVEDDRLRTVTGSCQIDKMRRSKEEHLSDRDKKMAADESKHGFNMLRKGQVGDWKNWFTVAQNERFDKWWAENTQGLDMFTFRYT